MKSEKAKRLLNNERFDVFCWKGEYPEQKFSPHGKYIKCTQGVYAVELAEQEAEQRMRDKAIKAFADILYMPAQQLAKECGVSVSDVTEDTGIDYCRKLFIQKLNVG